MRAKHRCPVCGYPDLCESPRLSGGGGSYEICPSCGFQFGVSDDDRKLTYGQWRERWRSEGMRWASLGIPRPRGWDPAEQLRRLLSGSV
jgi:hypothetical protein